MRNSFEVAVMLAFAVGCAHHQQQPQSKSTNPTIVHLVSRHQTITISASPRGPLYTVRTDAGRTLVADATLDELRVQHPDLYRQIEPALASSDASLTGPHPGRALIADHVP